jgi:hypothetical protein
MVRVYDLLESFRGAFSSAAKGIVGDNVANADS